MCLRVSVGRTSICGINACFYRRRHTSTCSSFSRQYLIVTEAENGHHVSRSRLASTVPVSRSRSRFLFMANVRVSRFAVTFAFPVYGSRVSRSCFSSTAAISRSGANVSRSRSRRVHVSHVSARQLL